MTYEIKIESGIPLPDPNIKKCRYPWRELEIGQSFVLRSKNAYSQCSRAGSVHQRKFVVRSIGNNEYRVWRVA